VDGAGLRKPGLTNFDVEIAAPGVVALSLYVDGEGVADRRETAAFTAKARTATYAMAAHANKNFLYFMTFSPT
jgi:hypothetical protein